MVTVFGAFVKMVILYRRISVYMVKRSLYMVIKPYKWYLTNFLLNDMVNISFTSGSSNERYGKYVFPYGKNKFNMVYYNLIIDGTRKWIWVIMKEWISYCNIIKNCNGTLPMFGNLTNPIVCNNISYRCLLRLDILCVLIKAVKLSQHNEYRLDSRLYLN